MKTRAVLLTAVLLVFHAGSAYAQGPTPPPGPTPVPVLPPGVQENWDWLVALIRSYGLGVVLILLVVLGSFFLLQNIGAGAGEALKEKTKHETGKLLEKKDTDFTRLYLDQVITDFRYFTFRGLNTRGEEIKRPRLDNAYISIRMLPESKGSKRGGKGGGMALGEGPEGEPHETPVSVDLAGAIQKSTRLAIVGAAGSGKSTLMQWAGLAAARVRVEPKLLTAEMRAFNAAAGAKPLIPILIPLRSFNRYCQSKKCGYSASTLLDFIRYYVIDIHPTLKALPEDFFSELLEKDGCLLMLDGVDEVDPDTRPLVRGAVEQLMREYEKNTRHRYLVTSRTAAYFGEAELKGFQKCDVQNLTPDERDHLIQVWCRAVHEKDKADAQAADLIRQLDASEEPVRALAVTPLMTTIFAMVHYYARQLPRQRAELYEHAVEILLTEVYKEGEDAAELKRDWETRRRLISLIAFTMHTEKLEDPTEQKLVEAVWQGFGQPSEKEAACEAARQFLLRVADRGGLLEEENGRYGFFTHRTFREFLAGRHLANKLTADRDFVRAFVAERLEDDTWVEPLRLAAGYLAIKDDDPPNPFIRLISGLGRTVEEKTLAFTLAGLCIADLPARGLPSNERLAMQSDVTAQMLTALTHNPPQVDAIHRSRMGRALGQAGDPRFVPVTLNGFKVIPPALVHIPAGPFQMGTSREQEEQLKAQNVEADEDEKHAHTVLLSEFSIGRYPVTNAEFRLFWEQKGYEDGNLWSAAGWLWRTGKFQPDLSVYREQDRKVIDEWLAGRPVEKRGQPFFWEDPKWNLPNLPVVGITWFEAEAYAKWLSAVTGEEYRLSSEAQWEKAARGPDNSLWPWGNEWDPARSNTDEPEKSIGSTTPVGMYPDGAWEGGPLDMTGNVWEWCADWFSADEYGKRQDGVKDPEGPAEENTRVLRGGSFVNDRWFARCAFRGWNIPNFFFNDFGFRVVLSPIVKSEL